MAFTVFCAQNSGACFVPLLQLIVSSFKRDYCIREIKNTEISLKRVSFMKLLKKIS